MTIPFSCPHIDDVLHSFDESRERLEKIREINADLREARDESDAEVTRLEGLVADLERRCEELTNDLAIANARITELEASGES